MEAGFKEIKVNSMKPRSQRMLAYGTSRNEIRGPRHVSQVGNTTLPAMPRPSWLLLLARNGWSV